jgi:hypothetical protein
MLHVKQFHWSQFARVQISSTIRLGVHIMRHREANFKTQQLKIQAEPLHFFEHIQGAFVVSSNHYLDHLGISWCLLTHLHGGHMCAF